MSTNFDIVKAAVGIRQYLTDCGYTIRGNRTKATWRGGDGYTVSIDQTGRTWYDHKAAVGGSVVDLCMLVENLDKAAALHALADRYGVTLNKTKTAKRRHRAEQLPPLTVSWLKVCIHVQYGNGETQSKELRLNPDEVKCYNALAKICGTARPIPLDLFDEALALVMKMHLVAKGGRK